MKDNFDAIIGYEEVKKELRLICDMLKNPEIYRKLGAGINEGLVLYGRPGTGKTTMVNCLIKESGRNSYVCRKKSSDGEFVKKIAETFEAAKTNAPAIILLDDFDKFSDQDEGDAEEFVTVQSCIDEIKNADVYVVATVNDLRKIPESLLRSGRLGKRVKVRLPKMSEAIEIIRHYLNRTGIGKDVDPVSVARMLDGESCATLENVINNAAMKAAYGRQSEVTMQNLVDSCLDIVFETSDDAGAYSEETLRKVAYHEAGHAVVSELLDPGSVSIASVRGDSGRTRGFVRYCRPDEKMDMDAVYYENTIKVSLAGKAATELVFGETDMGANEDLHNAFDRAQRLLDDRCMNGFHNWIQDADADFTAENRNRAMVMLLENNYREVKRIIASHRELLDRMAAELMQKVTLTYSEVQRICHPDMTEEKSA